MIIFYDDDYGLMELACDNCSDDITIDDVMSFSHAIDQAKREGWVIQKVESEYKHYCCKDCEAASEFG